MATTTAILLLATLFCLYTVLLYPLLLEWMARRRLRPTRKEFTPRRVSVILPVHNGERWLRAKMESLLALDYPADCLEILIISDGSSDGTEEIAGSYAGRSRLLKVPRGGKARALNRALEAASGEILFFTDVRQELSRDSLRQLVACFADPAVGAVSGELIIRDGRTKGEANVGLYWRYEKWIRINLSRLDSVLGATGCIYAMRRELAKPLPPDTLADDMYLPLAAFFRGYRVLLDTSAKAFDDPTGLETEFRRKVRTLAGVYQMVSFYPALVGPGNRLWLHFLSHKMARLAMPWAMLAGLAASFGLGEYRVAALSLQAGFYGLAALDSIVPESLALKRLTSPVRTFVVLMAASFCATVVFFVPPHTLWKAR